MDEQFLKAETYQLTELISAYIAGLPTCILNNTETVRALVQDYQCHIMPYVFDLSDHDDNETT